MAVGEAFIERGGFRFRKMSPWDQKEVVRRDTARQREESARKRETLKRDLIDFAADKGEAISTLREFDDETEEKTRGGFVDAFNTTDGKADVFELSVSDFSLVKPGCPEWAMTESAQAMIAHVAGLAAAERLQFAADLCGLVLGDEPAAGTEPGTDPGDAYGADANPMTPAADETTPAMTT